MYDGRGVAAAVAAAVALFSITQLIHQHDHSSASVQWTKTTMPAHRRPLPIHFLTVSNERPPQQTPFVVVHMRVPLSVLRHLSLSSAPICSYVLIV